MRVDRTDAANSTFAPVAQLAELRSPKPHVGGSSPSRCATFQRSVPGGTGRRAGLRIQCPRTSRFDSGGTDQYHFTLARERVAQGSEHPAFNRMARVRSPPRPPVGASSSGRTSRFERENPGSIPGAPANRHQRHVNSAARVLACLARSHGFESRTWRHSAPIAQYVERLVEAQEVAGSKPARCTTHCWPVAQLAEHSAVTGAAAGSSPAWPANTRTHSSAAERRCYKAEVLGSIPSACTILAALAQLEQSAGLRCRRPKVQVLHVAPSNIRAKPAALAQWIRTPGFDPRRPQGPTPSPAPELALIV
jgi:hypothetical protein